MIVLVCGGRDYRDSGSVYSALDAIEGISCIIEGGATGADCFAAEWANRTQTAHLQFKADWQQHGRAAGPIRNRQMLEDGKPDMVMAFPGGRGTENMIEQAKAAGVRVERHPVSIQPKP